MSVVPCVLVLSGRGIRNPNLCVASIGKGRYIFYDACHLVRSMTQKEFFAHYSFDGFEEYACHAFGNHGYGLGGIEGSLVVRLPVDEGEVEYSPEVVSVCSMSMAVAALPGKLTGVAIGIQV